MQVTRDEEKLGLNSSITNDIASTARTSSRDRLLHEEGKGFRVAMATLDGGRIGIAAQARRASRRPRTTSRASTRRSATRSASAIGEFQAIQQKLADMSTEIDAARLLVYRAAWLKDRASRTPRRARRRSSSPPRWRGARPAEAIQILGGYGYTKEFPVERYYRDAKITEIYEGTSEIQRLVIARSILG